MKVSLLLIYPDLQDEKGYSLFKKTFSLTYFSAFFFFFLKWATKQMAQLCVPPKS